MWLWNSGKIRYVTIFHFQYSSINKMKQDVVSIITFKEKNHKILVRSFILNIYSEEIFIISILMTTTLCLVTIRFSYHKASKTIGLTVYRRKKNNKLSFFWVTNIRFDKKLDASSFEGLLYKFCQKNIQEPKKWDKRQIWWKYIIF